ncbi:hypothetical protein [Chitinophaga pinensis]|uniref:ABM domain-containing protein n=1 Tax=Chitinophaga pinensis TaxID=79329 RepID=A0A5C6LNV8_9BACT|nr:hypothetical protein [Chitinophaga pinensis]TWV96186.1 hypothetical protein FEF09_23650 [Chitinophaga pinensis]
MIVVKVTYTVKDSFVAQNKQNINTFLQDFKKLAGEFRYTVYSKDNTFIHLSHFKDQEIQTAVLDVPSFKAFQAARDASGLIGAHHLEVLDLEGTNADIF